MKKSILCALLLSCGVALNAQELKPRLVVMTDIGPADVEPDDNESAVRLLSYADRFEIEMICTTIGWNCDPYPAEWQEYLNRVVKAYGKDVKRLMKRSEQKKFLPKEEEQTMQQPLGYWPSVDYIKSRVCYGSPSAGIGVIGEDNDTEGSNRLIQLALEDDPRPIWVTSWGGSNTLAQAIWRYKQTATPEQLKTFLHKFRIYTITDQDMQWSMRMQRDYSSHMWMRGEFQNDLKFIWDESAWLNQNELGKQNWDKYATLIQNHGKMGKVYPKFLWGVEGDTPSFLHLMPNGLNDPDDPTQVGWGGYHTFGLCPDSLTYAYTNWQEPQKSISDTYEKRFYPDEFNDFAARMEWADKGKGNHNPIVIVNGSQSIKPLEVNAEVGQMVTLDASESYDPDGDNLSFLWECQKSADGNLASLHIEPAEGPKKSLAICKGMGGKSIHLICEVRDDGPFQLVAYRRVIIHVAPEPEPEPIDSTQHLSLLIAGDIMQHDAQIKAAKVKGGYDYSSYFAWIKPEIERADVAIANLEVTMGGKPYQGFPCFSAPDEYLRAIQDAGFDLLFTGNNHSCDTRKYGIERTILMCDSIGMPHIGTYLNQEERDAQYPYLLEKNGVRIAILEFAYDTNGIPVPSPTIVNLIDTAVIAKDIVKAQSMHPDLILAFPHWGDEYQLLPNKEMVKLAQWFISRGVDHVIGGHPHVVQPIEFQEDSVSGEQHLVAYSLGNLVSDQSGFVKYGGMLLRLELEKSGPHQKARIANCGYMLTFVGRPQWSGRKNYRVYPVDVDPSLLSAKEKQKRDEYTDKARELFRKHNVGISEYFMKPE